MKELLVILAITFAFVLLTWPAKADSLVCYYSGTNKIMSVYTEGHADGKEYNTIKNVDIRETRSLIAFYDGRYIFFSIAIPCILINDKRGEITNLNKFYKHQQRLMK